MAINKKPSGSKLARTEIIQVRFDPKLRLAAELAAAKERRTLSSFIEWAVERAVSEVDVTRDEVGNSITGSAVVDAVWDIDEADRFVKLAMTFPELLTYDEQRVWKCITEYRWHSDAAQGFVSFFDASGAPRFSAIRNCWTEILGYAKGTLPAESIDEKLKRTFIPY